MHSVDPAKSFPLHHLAGLAYEFRCKFVSYASGIDILLRSYGLPVIDGGRGENKCAIPGRLVAEVDAAASPREVAIDGDPSLT